MKICETHENQMRTALWTQGMPPDTDPRAPQGPLVTLRMNLYQLIATAYPGATLNAPAEACPFCHGIPEEIIPRVAKTIREGLDDATNP